MMAANQSPYSLRAASLAAPGGEDFPGRAGARGSTACGAMRLGFGDVASPIGRRSAS